MARSMGWLGRGILVVENVQRPVMHSRPSKMGVVEAAFEIGLEHDWLDYGCPLFRPTQGPGMRSALDPLCVVVPSP